MKTRTILAVAWALALVTAMAALPGADARELPADVQRFLALAGKVSAKLADGEPLVSHKAAPTRKSAKRVAKAAKLAPPTAANPFAVTRDEQRNPSGDLVALGDYCLGPLAQLIAVKR
ncbi:MAG: hypothetical protein HW383_681 [Candidatus Magasanikbacteria bacterium]|nr:hypothetical protein [Candidatus Magasanikbacteria bacterium]